MSGGRTTGASGRLGRELAHDRIIADEAEAVWNWAGAAGQRRADRRAAFFREMAGLRPGRRALELGCGTGVFLGRVADSGADIVALDLSLDLLRRTRRALTGSPKVRLECGNAEQLCHLDSSFDAVYGSSVLHHLELEPALREVFRVLQPGGVMVFTEPNLLNPQIAWSFLVGPRRWFGLSPDEMAFTRVRPARLLQALGFRDVSVRPFDFLHPSTPARLTGRVDRLGRALERVPLVREIAGSLLIRAVRP